jgi:chaperonin GroEL
MRAGSLAGAQRLAKAVGSTLGPGGRSVVSDPYEEAIYGPSPFSAYPAPIVTKDGVSVAKQLNLLKPRIGNLGARLLIDAADRANEESGDGTTSCTVIAESILKEG